MTVEVCCTDCEWSVDVAPTDAFPAICPECGGRTEHQLDAADIPDGEKLSGLQ